jgi:hypothetical protein
MTTKRSLTKARSTVSTARRPLRAQTPQRLPCATGTASSIMSYTRDRYHRYQIEVRPPRQEPAYVGNDFYFLRGSRFATSVGFFCVASRRVARGGFSPVPEGAKAGSIYVSPSTLHFNTICEPLVAIMVRLPRRTLWRCTPTSLSYSRTDETRPGKNGCSNLRK